MLGFINGDYAVGIYSAAVKVYNIFKTILIAIYSVIIPRLTTFYERNDLENFKDLITKITSVIIFVLFPAASGLYVISDFIMYFMGGTEYQAYYGILQILSLALVFSIIAGIFSNCINICIGNEKTVLIGSVISAVINFVLNLFILPVMSFYGAALTTLIAEAFAFIWNYAKIKNRNSLIDMKSVLRQIIICGFACLCFILASYGIGSFVDSIIWKTIIRIVLSIIIYLFIMFVTGNKTIFSLVKLLKKKEC